MDKKKKGGFVLCLQGSHTFYVAFHCVGLPTLSSLFDYFFLIYATLLDDDVSWRGRSIRNPTPSP